MKSETKYVVDIMTANPVAVGPDTLAGAAERLAERRCIHELLVVEGYRLAGVVCRCDLERAGVAGVVKDWMRRDPVTIEDQESVRAAEELMHRRGVGCLPVVDWSGALRGIVTRGDLARAGAVSVARPRTCRSCGTRQPLGTREGASLCARCLDGCSLPRVANDTGYLAVGAA